MATTIYPTTLTAKSLESLVVKIEKMGFHPFVRTEDVYEYSTGGTVATTQLFVSAENGDDAADYGGEYRGDGLWINPKLEKLAEKLGCFWDWQNPGCIVLND